MTYLPSMEKPARLELIATLRTITEGKVKIEYFTFLNSIFK